MRLGPPYGFGFDPERRSIQQAASILTSFGPDHRQPGHSLYGNRRRRECRPQRRFIPKLFRHDGGADQSRVTRRHHFQCIAGRLINPGAIASRRLECTA